MKPKNKRMAIIVAGLLLFGGAAALVLTALSGNIIFFHSPTSIADQPPPTGRAIRLGGLVEDDSVEKQADGLTIHFRVTDLAQSVSVVYKGILPDLFREGQGVVTQGALDKNGVFQASEVLAKHDENYMPAEVAEALKASGRWKDYQQRGGESQVSHPQTEEGN
jgi:cytochrome c-type biogenesis protein CcmE